MKQSVHKKFGGQKSSKPHNRQRLPIFFRNSASDSTLTPNDVALSSLLGEGPETGQRPGQCDESTFDWVWSETLRLARQVLPIVAIGLVGAWLLLIPLIRRAQQEGWSVVSLFRAVVLRR